MGINFLLHNPTLNELEKKAFWKYGGKEVNAGKWHFLHFPQCFLPKIWNIA